MRLPTLTVPARPVRAFAFGSVPLGLWPATQPSGDLPELDAQAVATDIGSPSGDVGRMPFRPVADADLFRPIVEATSSPLPAHVSRPPWWNDTIPRVDPISQLDNGPFENVNCVMASGA